MIFLWTLTSEFCRDHYPTWCPVVLYIHTSLRTTRVRFFDTSKTIGCIFSPSRLGESVLWRVTKVSEGVRHWQAWGSTVIISMVCCIIVWSSVSVAPRSVLKVVTILLGINSNSLSTFTTFVWGILKGQHPFNVVS